MTDYKKLEHALGFAGNLPRLLDDLDESQVTRSGGEAESRSENAYWELRKCLVLAGRSFSASDAAIADLVARILAKPLAFRLAVLLLAELITADHRDWIVNDRGKRQTLQGLSSTSHAAVKSLVPTAVTLLQSEEQRTRIIASFFLGCAVGKSEVAEQALLVGLRGENDGLVRANFALALAANGKGSDLARDTLRRVLANANESVISRGAAGVGLLWLGEAPSPLLDHGLSLWLGDLRECRAESSLDLPWARANRERLVCLIAMGEGREAAVLDRVLSALSHWKPGSSPNPQRYVNSILALSGLTRAWPAENDATNDRIEPNRHFALLPEELSPLQRHAMLGLSKFPDIWVGLPVPKYTNVFRRWLELEPPGILEQRVEVLLAERKVSRPRWWVWENIDEESIPGLGIEGFVDGLPSIEKLKLGLWVRERLYGRRAGSARALGGASLSVLALSLTAGDATDVSVWADELCRFRLRHTEIGPIAGISPVDRAILMQAILSSGARQKPEWVALMPNPGNSNRAIYEKLPLQFREEGAYRNLLLERCNLFKECLETLELYPSRRMVERLLEQNYSLEKMMRPSSSYQKLLVPKLDEMAKSNPELKGWYDAWMKRFREEGEVAHMKYMEERGVANEYLTWDLGILATQRIVERLLDLAVIDQKEGRSQLYWTRDSLGWLACERKEVAEWILGWEEKHQRKALVSERKKWAGENQATPKGKSAATSKAKAAPKRAKVPPKPAKKTTAPVKKAGAKPATKTSLPKKKAGAKK